jgi:cellobiose phosphorylase
MPWVNVICTGRYGLVVSQNGGGFSWFDDAQHNVITRWEMDLVRDCYGKFLYLADFDAGDVWSLSPQPCMKPYDRFSCLHEPGVTTFESAYSGIDATWALTVSHDHPAEVWAVTLVNNSGRVRRLRLASYFEWCCNTAPDVKREFHRLFFDIKHDEARHAIIAHKNMWDIHTKTEREHWNKPWPYVAATAMIGDGLSLRSAIGDKELFLGKYGSTAAPAALRSKAPVSGGFGRFGDAVASLGGDFTLAPGASITLHYVVAIGANEAEVVSTVDALAKPGVAAAEFGKARAGWDRLISKTKISTARSDFDAMNNTWLPYQAISGRLWGRTGYYQQSGAFGFRDQLQDSQVWLPLDPANCKKQILLHAERQFVDGSVYHWWHVLANLGNHTACSDDYLWLAYVTASYIRETGDLSILDVNIPFVDDPKGATLREHCRRSIARTFKRTSARGIPFIGSMDWNDGLSAMGIDEKGESVWVGMFLCQILADWEHISKLLGDSATAAEYKSQRGTYAAAINAVAWDPHDYYMYGTKDSGEWVGSSASPEGNVHLNAQTWAILSEIAPADRAVKAWDAVKAKLLTDYGPLLVHPAYTIPDPDIGYITRYSPGSRENGGVYMHAATWALAAACKVKDQASVTRIWNSVTPPVRSKSGKAYFAEPYVLPGNVDGPLSDKPGRAGWTWYTGSAAWLNRVSLEWIMGVRPVWGGLMVDPCPVSDMGKVAVSRVYRGVTVNIKFDAADFGSGRKVVLAVDGVLMPEGVGIIEQAVFNAAQKAGRTVEVEVKWSSAAAARDVEIKPVQSVGV